MNDVYARAERNDRWKPFEGSDFYNAFIEVCSVIFWNVSRKMLIYCSPSQLMMTLSYTRFMHPSKFHHTHSFELKSFFHTYFCCSFLQNIEHECIVP
jgi:hypothetical protein